jgi:hypothetical protein
MRLGTDLVHGAPVEIDLPRLLETRMLVQANSGGGKSWALRRVLEQTAPHVQQLVIDPEGEFATLREKFDFIIAAPHDGDAVASPQTAALLAKRLLETGVSAVLDIYDLKAHERQQFVKRFLDALVNAPRKLWHPVLVVIDEAHVYCPQTGGAEAMGAVIDVCTRGRKRGLCPILATQRLSKLHKDAAAEMLNKLVGRTGLDVDVKRAADELGMSAANATAQLRSLKPGHFFAFGPAITSNEVKLIDVGMVETTHPKPGDRLMKAPPAPSARVRASLAKLADLQKEAEQEAADVESLRAQVKTLQRDLRSAVNQRNALDQGPNRGQFSEADVQRRIAEAVKAAPPTATDIRARQLQVPRVHEMQRLVQRIGKDSDQLASLLDVPRERLEFSGMPIVLDPRLPEDTIAIRGRNTVVSRVSGDGSGLRSGAIKILKELAARMPAGYTRSQVGLLTGFTPSGGTFGTYISNLRKAGFIEERDGLVFATEAGAIHLGGDIPAAPTTHEEAMALWGRALRAGAFRLLGIVVAAGRGGINRNDLAVAAGLTGNAGTFGTYLSNLRTNGLVSESGKQVVANDILFPERPK